MRTDRNQRPVGMAKNAKLVLLVVSLLMAGCHAQTTDLYIESGNNTAQIFSTKPLAINAPTTTVSGDMQLNGKITSASALILYLLDQQFYVEAQYSPNAVTGAFTMMGPNRVPVGAKAIWADVFINQEAPTNAQTGARMFDHFVLILGDKVDSTIGTQLWSSPPGGPQASKSFNGSMNKRYNHYVFHGDNDGFSTLLGEWFSSQTVLITSDGQLFWAIPGYNGINSGWIYVLVKGYYL
eukprot:Colp12_sorted_trinity150504_noHs@29187